MDLLVLDWLKGLACYGSVFIKLIPSGKRPPIGSSWRSYEQAHERNGGACLDEALGWLKQGAGVGFLLRGDIWVLDVDAPGEVEDILCRLAKSGIFPPWVQTPSGGAHLYFLFPKGFRREDLKNHLLHPLSPDGIKLRMDFKLGPRTLLVAPGTIRGARCYQPMAPWCSPPEIGPDRILPTGEFWFPSRPCFSVDERTLDARVSRACAYLRAKWVPISVSGRGGRSTLASVCAHLVVFLRLDPALACHLLCHGPNPWNSRCITANGRPYPWSPEELWKACTEAVDAIPQAGVTLHKQLQAKAMMEDHISIFAGHIKTAQQSGNCNNVEMKDLCAQFNSWSGDSLRAHELSVFLGKCGIKRVIFSKRRISGVNLDPSTLKAFLVEKHRG